MMRFLLSGLVAVSLFVAPVPRAAAQVATSDAEARSLFEAGRIAYEGGRYEDALGHFRRAYELSHRAALLYNIGSSLDRLRRDADALAAFEAYLAEPSNTSRRPEVEQRIRILREQVAAAAAIQPANVAQASTDTAAPVADPVDTAPAARTGIVHKWWFWTAIGVVVVGAAVGIGVAAGGGGGTQGPESVNSGTVILRL